MKDKLVIANKKRCYLCSSKTFIRRKGVVRDKKDLRILECTNCGLVFLSSFSHIYDEFYSDSKMHGSGREIDAWINEAFHTDERRYKTLKKLIKNKSVLDFGCGVGGFLKRARKVASSIQGVEPERRLRNYFKKEKIFVVTGLENVKKNFDVITLFHVLEHVPDPVLILNKLSKKLKNKGRIIVEVPNANDALFSVYKCKAFSRFTYWSCHLFLFTNSTLREIAEKAGLKVNIKQIQRYPLSNHLHWLSVGNPGGHKLWNFLDNKDLNRIYEKKLRDIEACDTILAIFSKKTNSNQ